MTLRSLHPQLSQPQLDELRRTLDDLRASLDQLREDTTALVAAQFEMMRCSDHVDTLCRLCPADGPLSASSRRDAAKATSRTLRLLVAAQLIDVFHAADPSLSEDEIMTVMGEAWTAIADDERRVGG